MAKTVVREIIIALLICIAIILVLGLLFYEYVPMGKTIPNSAEYTTPADVKEELSSSQEVDESKVIMTYEVDSTDLSNYARIRNYKPGKANPFSSYETVVADGTNATSGGGTSSTTTTTNPTNSGSTNTSTSTNTNTSTSTSNTNSKTTSSSTSGGKFFQDKGTK